MDSSPPAAIQPNYEELVRFLVKPFLDAPDALRIDCEVSPRTSRVLIRVAFEGEDKGRVFGRGGRNIQAIRTVLQGVGRTAGHAVHLEIFGSTPGGREDSSDGDSSRSDARRSRRPRTR